MARAEPSILSTRIIETVGSTGAVGIRVTLRSNQLTDPSAFDSEAVVPYVRYPGSRADARLDQAPGCFLDCPADLIERVTFPVRRSILVPVLNDGSAVRVGRCHQQAGDAARPSCRLAKPVQRRAPKLRPRSSVTSAKRFSLDSNTSTRAYCGSRVPVAGLSRSSYPHISSAPGGVMSALAAPARSVAAWAGGRAHHRAATIDKRTESSSCEPQSYRGGHRQRNLFCPAAVESVSANLDSLGTSTP